MASCCCASRAAYIRTLRLLLAREPEELADWQALVRQLLAADDVPAAQTAMAGFITQFPQREEPLLLACEVAVALRDQEALQHALAQLRALPVTLSPEALRVIRYWTREVKHG